MALEYIGNKYWGDSDRASRIYLSKKLEPYGLDGSRFIFFVRTCRQPGCTQTELMRASLFDKSMVTRCVFQLEEQGLIYRETDAADRRVMHVYPTEKGKQIFEEVSDIIKDWNRKIYASLPYPEQEVEEILRLIAKSARTLLHEAYGVDCIEED